MECHTLERAARARLGRRGADTKAKLVRKCQTRGMSSRSGALLGAAAYVLWGVLPAYFKLLQRSGPFEIVAQRATWALVLCLFLIVVLRRGAQLREVLRSRRQTGILAAAAAIVVINWTLYVYAVTSGHTLEAALGYFITPLVSALLGVVVLGERLRPAQWVAFGVGFAAVAVLAVAYGHFPLISVAIAVSFGVYGLLKKQVGARVGAIEGLTVETLAIVPLALVYLTWLNAGGMGTVDPVSPYGLIIMLSGPVTAVPLILFAAAAARVSLTTIGMLQYIAPVGQFLLGWLAFSEPMPPARWAGFLIVWVAVIIFALDAARAAAKARPPRLEHGD